MGGASSARTLYGLSPYADSVRTQTAHFASYTSAYVPKRCLLSTYSLRTRGFIRGSIPLSSTIKRLVRRGSGKANGQKPKMYGHANRIAGQDKGSGKLPVLLDCCVHTAYSWCMTTTNEGTQRDELARTLKASEADHSSFERSMIFHREVATDLLAAGYRKPRTIPGEHFLCDQDYGTYAAEYPENTIVQAMDGSLWYRDDEGDWSHIGSGSAELRGPAIVIHEPEAEVGA